MTESEQKDPQASGPFPRAGLMRRMAALLYDGFLVAAIWMVLGFVLQLFVGPETNQLVDGVVQTDPVLDAILFALMILSSSGFYIWFWSRSGQTLGMIAWRIKVETLDGSRINLKQGLIRFFAAWPAFFLFGLGYLSLYLDANGDAIHDKMSQTKVVLLPKSHRPFD
ncbi:MAG: RDD family protein [Gammaproteobacteria bacterium]|nr:RDD family protein [Gammaproteobacteria bacterium]MDG2337316.1 RDD family protein [Gammaproteobacteria bacterium]